LVKGALEILCECEAENRKGLVAKLISFERIAVIAREASGPVVLRIGEDGSLEGETLLDGLETELVNI
jgi:hypothetical protein